MKTWFVTYQYEDSSAREIKGHGFFSADDAQALEVELGAFEQTVYESKYAIIDSFLLTFVNRI